MIVNKKEYYSPVQYKNENSSESDMPGLIHRSNLDISEFSSKENENSSESDMPGLIYRSNLDIPEFSSKNELSEQSRRDENS